MHRSRNTRRTPSTLIARDSLRGITGGYTFSSRFAGSLSSQDKLGNFAIQDLMSAYNQAQSLASSILKKSDDTNSGIIGKI